MDATTSVQFLPGVGPARAKRLAKLRIETIEDLLWHVPRSHMDRSRVVGLGQLVPGEIQSVRAEIARTRLSRRGNRISIFEADLRDEGGELATAIWFNQPFLSKTLTAGKELLLHGKVALFRSSRPQIQSPEYEILEGARTDRPLHAGRVVPLYPLTAGITQKQFRTWVQTALEQVENRLPDPIPETIRIRYELPRLRAALERVHFPESMADAQSARDRLAFDEFIILQLAFGLVKRRRIELGHALCLRGTGEIEAPFRESLSYTLTGGQEAALAEIRDDLGRERPMNRLLQGDVGSGKTVVAALAAITALESDTQVAYMVPTEILALQQAESFRQWFQPMGRRTELLIGRTGAADRRQILTGIHNGHVDILVGTHALIEEAVDFRQLGLIVVDEQHRFGVMQRGQLRKKGEWPHNLVMSATPIPRTMSLTLYGDLELSLMTEMPPGREPPKSYLVPPIKREPCLHFVADLVKKGERAFFIYPLVEESEQSDLKDATRMAGLLARHQAFAGVKIGLLHGRMKGDEKEAAIERFRDGTTPVLVSTTVVEVGVNVPQATCMVVEHPERFGLSQLHQLRGRVGRGGGESHFFMLTAQRLAPESRERLQVLVKQSNGFAVAEEDLRIRGPGDLLGTAQHGLPQFRVGDLIRDPDLLSRARDAAEELLQVDPGLEASEHESLRDMVRRRHGKGMNLFQVG